jgi:hypothetical protein
VILDETEVAGLQKRLKAPGRPKDGAALIRYQLKKSKAVQKPGVAGPKR